MQKLDQVKTSFYKEWSSDITRGVNFSQYNDKSLDRRTLGLNVVVHSCSNIPCYFSRLKNTKQMSSTHSLTSSFAPGFILLEMGTDGQMDG